MKILVIRLSSLGDIIITEPVVHTLATQFPVAEIYYLVKPGFKDLMLTFPANLTILPWNDDLDSLIKLRRIKFDILIDLHNKPNTALIRLFCRAKIKTIYNKKHSLRHAIVTHKTTQSISSTLDLYFSALSKINISPEPRYPQIVPDDSAKEIMENHGLKNNDFILIFPGATSNTKRWLTHYFAELINLIVPSMKVVLAGGNSEKSITSEVTELCHHNIIDLTAKTNLRQLISLTDSAQAVIANDSGPAHIAAALHKPQITIFGATSPKLGFAPLNDKNVLISQNLPCSPCSLHGSNSCPLHHFNCMKTITPQIIYKELLKIL